MNAARDPNQLKNDNKYSQLSRTSPSIFEGKAMDDLQKEQHKQWNRGEKKQSKNFIDIFLGLKTYFSYYLTPFLSNFLPLFFFLTLK